MVSIELEMEEFYSLDEVWDEDTDELVFNVSFLGVHVATVQSEYEARDRVEVVIKALWAAHQPK